jgi:hypothetical protein
VRERPRYVCQLGVRCARRTSVGGEQCAAQVLGPSSVEYIIVKGRDPATGQAIEEKIVR